MIFENMDRIIFAGDSVTDMGSAQPVGEGLFDNMGHGYPRVIESLVTATYPELSIVLRTPASAAIRRKTCLRAMSATCFP